MKYPHITKWELLVNIDEYDAFDLLDIILGNEFIRKDAVCIAAMQERNHNLATGVEHDSNNSRAFKS